MKINKTNIDGVVEILPNIFKDERGYFFESFNSQKFNDFFPDITFVQDNESFSTKGTLRGLHFQKPPYAQDKLVRVIKGKVLDVAVDLRVGSATYGQYTSLLLDAEKHNMFLIPKGFAHGFYTIEDAIFQYKCSDFYNKESEGGLLWSDPELNIDWKIDTEPIVSEKDQILPLIKDIKSNFSI